MAGNRKAFVQSFLSDLELICPGHGNEVFYNDYFDRLSDKEFDQLVADIKDGTYMLPLIVPNLKKAKLNVERNLKLAEKWGHPFWQKLWLVDPADTSVQYLSNPEYLVLKVPVRRQAQTLDAGLSTPMDNNQVDEMTGQVTGASKSSAMTAPEVQILANDELYAVLEEFLKPRGGDQAAYNAIERSIIETGVGTLKQGAAVGSRPKSTETLGTRMKAAHLGNNL